MICRGRLSLLSAILMSWNSSVVLAESSPRSGPLDKRIKYIQYNKDEVVVVNGSYGASTMIVFQDDEKIETLGAGDAIAWKVEPNKKGNVLFVKPVEKNANANLNVLTSKRSYVFVLQASFRPVAEQVFKIQFRYPDDEADSRLLAQAQEIASQPNRQQLDVRNVNSAYSFKGSSVNKPLTIFDDGTKTWFKFSGNVPAIFVVDGDRNESLVNFHREGDYIIVDRINYQWTLRTGDEITCIFNNRLNDLNEPTGFENNAPKLIAGRTITRPAPKGVNAHALSK